MIVKLAAFAAAVCVSTGAASQPANSHAVVTTPVRSTAARRVVLDNIIGRVQLDVLIAQIVASDRAKSADVRGTIYADVGSTKLRNRS